MTMQSFIFFAKTLLFFFISLNAVAQVTLPVPKPATAGSAPFRDAADWPFAARVAAAGRGAQQSGLALRHCGDQALQTAERDAAFPQ